VKSSLGVHSPLEGEEQERGGVEEEVLAPVANAKLPEAESARAIAVEKARDKFVLFMVLFFLSRMMMSLVSLPSIIFNGIVGE